MMDGIGNCAQESSNSGKKLGVRKADLYCRSDPVTQGV